MADTKNTLPFIDLAAQQELIRDKLDAAIARVLDHGQYIMGPEVKQFEQALQDYTGVAHAIGCANGTDALRLALMAWGCGAGDAVFVPALTFAATAEAPAQLAAMPFFVDILEDTFNIDPQSFARAIGEARKQGLRPKVVIAVDLFGQPADVDAICDIAHAEGIKVLVDAAQSFGATNRGRHVATLGDAATTSFFPAKPLGCYGDGGAVFTQDAKMADLLRSLRVHGSGAEKYEHLRIGVNSRLDTIQAAILIEKLQLLPEEMRLRARLAQDYSDALTAHFKTPQLMEGVSSAWAQYTLVVEARDALQAKLKQAGIPSVVYYPKTLPQQPGYADFPVIGNGTPIADMLVQRVLSLPMSPYLVADEVLGRMDFMA